MSQVPEFEAKPVFEAYSLVAGAHDESHYYDFFDEAWIKAAEIAREYEQSCYGITDWEVGVAYQYETGDVIEGSQWAGDEPVILSMCMGGDQCQCKTLEPDDIPASHPVRPLNPGDEGASAGCGQCGLWWDDEVSTSWTPVPSARCPFEYWHK